MYIAKQLEGILPQFYNTIFKYMFIEDDKVIGRATIHKWFTKGLSILNKTEDNEHDRISQFLLHHIERISKCSHLIYEEHFSIGREYRWQGYGTKAMKLLLSEICRDIPEGQEVCLFSLLTPIEFDEMTVENKKIMMKFYSKMNFEVIPLDREKLLQGDVYVIMFLRKGDFNVRVI